jgi:hypothetical protein
MQVRDMHGNAKEVLDDNFLLKEFIKKFKKIVL